jgi:D-serine deaminase-like pyridoxal phosphate-dependent protein
MLEDLPTPAVIVDRRRLLDNLNRIQKLAGSSGARLRPHAKTHKSPTIAAWQIERGAVGVCCAKVGEAEVFVEAGIADVRIPYPLQPIQAPRILKLMDRASISTIVDHLEVARGWSARMEAAGRRLDILIKVDVGFHRCGIDPGSGALEFVEAISRMNGLRLRGLLSHAGHGYRAASEAALDAIAGREAEILLTLKQKAARSGISLDEISVGATPTLRFSAAIHGLTELRPGNYPYFDRTQTILGSASLDQCALSVLATVVSKSTDRIILDCGSKILSSDLAPRASGYGAVLTPDGSAIDETLSIDRLSEEHATVGVRGRTALQPGDRVRVLPNHACVVSNLVDEVWLLDEDGEVERLPVAARGKVR